eukprot:SAG22_NODE_5005_length_1109_cov_1.335312_1_plen_131_part_00
MFISRRKIPNWSIVTKPVPARSRTLNAFRSCNRKQGRGTVRQSICRQGYNVATGARPSPGVLITHARSSKTPKEKHDPHRSRTRTSACGGWERCAKGGGGGGGVRGRARARGGAQWVRVPTATVQLGLDV